MGNRTLYKSSDQHYTHRLRNNYEAQSACILQTTLVPYLAVMESKIPLQERHDSGIIVEGSIANVEANTIRVSQQEVTLFMAFVMTLDHVTVENNY